MNLVPNPLYIALQMIPFLVLIVALKALIFDPLLNYLEERHRRITGFSNDAKSMGEETEQRARDIETQLAQARVEIADVRTKILQSATGEERRIVEDARARAEQHATRFREELAETRRAASEALRADVESMSQDIASRVLGRPVS